MHGEHEFKLGSNFGLKLELKFFSIFLGKYCQTTIGAHSNLVMQDDFKLKLGLDFGPQIELMFFVIV